jgi:hypothetical protein
LFVANGTPATCFAFDRGLTATDVQGACRGFAIESAPYMCAPVELSCPLFVPQPSEDAVRDGGADGADAAGTDASPADTDDGGDTDDGAAPDGGASDAGGGQ